MEAILKELGILVKDLSIFGTGLLVWSGIIALSWKADEAIAIGPRLALGRKIRGIEVREDIEGWPDIFARIFDRVFVKRNYRRRFRFWSRIRVSLWKLGLLPLWFRRRPRFWRSCVASLLAVAVMILVYETVNPEYGLKMEAVETD